ncbi:NAD(P)H-binding protein [Frondihabitans cladoniiphilus]|uniref:SDR family oxidoreductase n=1 Tax=Frondihabitans cladoniiphilus TaxID=715785 RepID=A0ABP8VPI6_9MICO
MARIVIVGGNGLTARHLISRLSNRGDHVVPLIRHPAQADHLVSLGGHPDVLDLETGTVDEFAAAFTEADAVVFAAGVGSNGGSVESIDRDGAIKSIDAAVAAGVPRFVQISAIGATAGTPPTLTGSFWEAYYEAKRAGDAHLRSSGLGWTVLEPAELTENLATDGVTLGVDVPRGASISRADLAAVVVAVLDEPRAAGHTWELVGGTTPVVDAVAAAVAAAAE